MLIFPDIRTGQGDERSVKAGVRDGDLDDHRIFEIPDLEQIMFQSCNLCKEMRNTPFDLITAMKRRRISEDEDAIRCEELTKCKRIFLVDDIEKIAGLCMRYIKFGSVSSLHN